MSARPESGYPFAQLDPQKEASTASDFGPTYPADLIEPLSVPLHALSNWDQTGIQRHIDERVELLKEADIALANREFYLAKSCVARVIDNVSHSVDTYMCELDDYTKDNEFAPHKLAQWFLRKALYDIDEAANPTPAIEQAQHSDTYDDGDDQTIIMQAVA